MKRQQVLYLWLAEGALDTATIAWAFYDGAGNNGPALPDSQPPYSTGVAAMEDGWFLIQSPALYPLASETEQATGYLQNEFIFERIVEPKASGIA